MLQKLLCGICITFAVLFSASALADDAERITHFSSIIVVNTDASIDIIENIRVYANGDQLKHGLVRWLPTKYVDSYGISRQASYKIKQIEMNDAKSPYHFKYQNNQFVIYIGDKNILLEPGFYNYRIDYHVNNAVNFLKDADELYWNITGNGWNFPLLKVDAKIQLPASAQINHYFGYTGKIGEKGTDFIARKKNDSQIAFMTTRPLQPGAGLTIAVAWQKSLVTPPTWQTKLRQELNPSAYILLGLNAIVFFYLLYSWWGHGRDPKAGTIIPLFEPPQNLSPEAIRYIKRMGFDIKTFSAAVVSIASKGFAAMKQEKSTFILTQTKDAEPNLPIEEKDLLQNLFKSSKSIALKNANYEVIGKAKRELKKDLENNYQEKYFKTNFKYLFVSLALTLVGFLATIFYSEDKGAAFFAIIWLTVWSAVTSGLILNVVKTFRDFYIFKTVRGFFAAVFALIFAIPFSIAEIFALFAFTNLMPFFTIPLLFMLIVMNVVFYFLLRAHTPEGRKIVDEIEGFKMFLATTEQDRLQELNPPAMTPEIFEKYLPYAIALDVENAWGEHFNLLLKNAGVEPQTYHPVWYTGTSPWTSSTTAAIPLFIGSALASSLANSSVSSSSSSGGGSSGGGSGGGGGGGW